MIIYTLLGGYPPFHDENQTRLFRRIKAGSFKFHDEYWSNTSLEAKVRQPQHVVRAQLLLYRSCACVFFSTAPQVPVVCNVGGPSKTFQNY